MKRIVLLGLVLSSLVASVAIGQEPAVVDKVGQEASQLEAELGKFKDTSPEAAEIQVKLVDLYHANGRAFGLIRAAQSFASSHPSDPRHQAVMFKLIDGLEAMTRNKDLTVACRQFLSRYPKAPQCPDVELRLAHALAEMREYVAAGDAYRAVWQRQPTTELGRQSGGKAVHFYAIAGTAHAPKAAELAEEMVDKLPAGKFTSLIGRRGFYEWRRISQWAKSNVIGGKLLKKGVAGDKKLTLELHRYMAENYRNQSQHANSAASFRLALALSEEAPLRYGMVYALYHAGTKAAQLLPEVTAYQQKYPQLQNAHTLRNYLAFAYLRDGDKVNGLRVLGDVLGYDAKSNGGGTTYVSTMGIEPAQLAATEKVLLAAIAKNKTQTAYLRYTLALSLYRDRIKDTGKTRLVLRDLITQSPSNDSYSSYAINWLLDNATDENEFRADVARIIATRKKYIEWTSLRNYLGSWAQQAAKAKKNPALQARGNYVKTEIQKANADPVVSLWLQIKGGANNRSDVPIRAQLIEPQMLAKQTDAQARALLYAQNFYYRHYSPGAQRINAAKTMAIQAQRFPSEYRTAITFLVEATNYAGTEITKPAAQHLLKFEPESGDADIWRRLMVAGDQSKDPAFVKQVYAWITKSEQKFGNNPISASYIGDVLLKYELETEAIARWTKYASFDRSSTESRECAIRLLPKLDEAKRIPFLVEMLKHDTNFHGKYAELLGGIYYANNDLANFEKVLRDSKARQLVRPYVAWDMYIYTVVNWVSAARAKEDMPEADKKQVFTVVRDLELGFASASADLALLELTPPETQKPIERLLAYQRPTRRIGDAAADWDYLISYAQTAITKKDYVATATLVTGMLTNIRGINAPRQKLGRDMVAQSYARIGAVGLTIDEDSPIAPLLQAALYLRLGDDRLAFDTYTANKALFDEHRNEAPVDLLVFVCDRLIAAGGEENHEQAETILRGWIVARSEGKQYDGPTKARVQLLLAKNYYKAQRYDVARSEYTTVINRYPETAEAVEAQFGIGESFMAQKVYDQAELVFEKLAGSREVDIVVRAEFLRGVLAFRRGDRDEARDIFRGVLERVPSIGLANQALYNLSEVYGAEERYLDQLNLLRTVGRLGNISKRRHTPGMPLSIVVHDSDLGISRGHSRIKVIVTTVPGGDRETVNLTSAGAGKGLFRTDLDTRLGKATPGDNVLQLTGRDTIRCDYPQDFKTEFRNVPLSDVEITVAANAEFDVSSSKIVDRENETFSEQLEREAREEEESDQRRSQGRPENQIKPGNLVYLRVKDADRDLTDDPDTIVVKMEANSGDQVQARLTETGPHTGVFEGSLQTGELPAGALASDTAIDHSPLMSIDRDPKTYWLSEPDGATPKTLTIDLKDLKTVSRVKVFTPDTEKNAPVRGRMLGSYDGQFWFRLAANPPLPEVENITGKTKHMQRRVYSGNYTNYTTWQQVVTASKNGKFIDEAIVDELSWTRDPDDEENANKAFAAIWSGKLVQPRDGAARIAVAGVKTAVVIDGKLELPVGPGNRSVDVWLTAGTHDLSVFSAVSNGSQTAEATWARANLKSSQVTLSSFRADDFDIEKSAATKRYAPPLGPQQVDLELGLETVQYNKKTEQFGPYKPGDQPQIGNWKAAEDSIHWEFEAVATGAYDVFVECAHQGGGSRYVLEFGKQFIDVTTPNTGNLNTFQQQRVGTIVVNQTGKQTLAIKPVEIKGGNLMDLRGVTLRPATDARVVVANNAWEFRFAPLELRYVRFVVNEYLGEALAINHIEVGGRTADQLYIPTVTDVLSLANNEVLEIAGGDVVTATYADQFTQNVSGSSQLLTENLTATYYDAEVASISYDFLRNGSGAVQETRKELLRVDPGERFIVEIVDYDEDQSAKIDKIHFQVVVNEGEPVEMVATETEEFSGIFTKEVDTSATEEGGKLTVRQGDRIYVSYRDGQNTFPGHAVPRETVVYVNEPSLAQVRILETRVIPPPAESTARPRVVFQTPEEGKEISGVAFTVPLTVEVIDPDAAKDSRSSVVVKLKTTDGTEIEVNCVVSDNFTDRLPNIANAALLEGRFVGQVIMQLGGKNSTDLVPLTSEMPRNLTGGPVVEEDSEISLANSLVTRVLNLTGKDIVAATYKDERRPDGKPLDLDTQGRLIVNGTLAVTDRDYDKEIDRLHVGEKLFLIVSDADRDSSDERDSVTVDITTAEGEEETVALHETLAHSGVFTGSLLLKASEKPEKRNLNPEDPNIECYFGNTIRLRYFDEAAGTEEGTLEQLSEVPVVIGTNGLLLAFTKVFNDENLAVETKFTIAESYFELFKSHKDLGRDDEQKVDLESGRRILREVMEDYPDPKYAPRIAYLLGQFAQELEQWNEAIASYDMIIRQFPDHSLAADAQYKMAQSHEEAGDFDKALEAYVTLAATYPKSPLIANVMIRISDHFYKGKEYDVAAQVGKKFQERFTTHEFAPRMAFRVGQCYYKAKKYIDAAKSFDEFAKKYPDDKLCSQALFWSGESFRMGNNNPFAFRRYNRCRWDFPASEAAKYARGRLALPEMLQQFEAAANDLDQ